MVPVAIWFTLVALLLLGLAGCGGDEPTPTATAVVPGGSQATSAPVGAATPGTLRTAGDLADRIAAAWGTVRTYRSTFTAITAPGSASASSPVLGTPANEAPSLEIVDEVVLPDRKHRTIREAGALSGEFVGIGGRVFLRGPIAQAIGRPNLDPGRWIEIDPAAVNPASPISGLIADLAAPAEPPYAALPAETRALPISPLGSVEVEGQTCAAYDAVDTTDTGERIEVTIALGPDDLPCLLETRAGGTVNRTVFSAYNAPLTIEPPVVATPNG